MYFGTMRWIGIIYAMRTSAVSSCLVCGKYLNQPEGKGRPRLYCSQAHRQRAYEDRRLKEAYDRGYRARRE